MHDCNYSCLQILGGNRVGYRVDICGANIEGVRPNHLQILDGPKMARSALSRWAVDAPRVSNLK